VEYLVSKDRNLVELQDGSVIGDRPLHVAARNHRHGAINCLLKLGAQIEACNKAGETPLRIAARWAGVAAVDELVKHGADVFSSNENGKRASDLAALSEIRTVLLEAELKADPARCANDVLHFAVEHDDKGLLTRALEAGCDPMFAHQGKTALELAQSLGREECAALIAVFQARQRLRGALTSQPRRRL
jgi:ankyrin repeat protein